MDTDNKDNTINTDADNTADNTVDNTADVNNTADVDNTVDNTTDDNTADAAAAADNTTDDNTAADNTADTAADNTVDNTVDNTAADTAADNTTDDAAAADNTSDNTADNTTDDTAADTTTATADTTAAATDTATSDTDITSAITDTDSTTAPTGDTPTDDNAPDNGESTSDAGDSTSDDTPSKPSASEWIMAHKWIIAVIVIVSIIIICIALFFGYKYYKKYQAEQAQDKNVKKLDLELCVYGVNAAETTCKDKKCVSGQINSIYGECKELTTYCVAPKFKNGELTINNKNCVRDCNYTGTSTGRYTKPVWKASYNTKYPSITAYMYVYENDSTGNCRTKCAPNAIAKVDPVYCNQACIADSAHTAKGKCTGMGCRSGMTINKLKCNNTCPTLIDGKTVRNNTPGKITQYQVTKGPYSTGEGKKTEGLYDTKVFGHSDAKKCTTTFNCGGHGIVYLSQKTRNQHLGVWECKYTQKDCSGKLGVVSTVKTANHTKQVCHNLCSYGTVTKVLVGDNKTKMHCNTPCIGDTPYPTYQNTIVAGACKTIKDMPNTYPNGAKTLQGHNLRKVWGYKANKTAAFENVQTMHGVFTTKTHGANTLWKATYGTKGILGRHDCTNGVSKDNYTKCNKKCPNVHSKNITNNKKWSANNKSNTCTTDCNNGNLGLTTDAAISVHDKVCKVACTGKSIADSNHGTKKGTFNGHNVYYKDHNYTGPCKLNTKEGGHKIICHSHEGVCYMNTATDCKKFGVNKAGTNCNVNGHGYCGTSGTTKTILGGNTYQKHFNTKYGICKSCTNGVNYNITGCNEGVVHFPSQGNKRCWQFTDEGGCTNPSKQSWNWGQFTTVFGAKANNSSGKYFPIHQLYNAWGWENGEGGGSTATCYSAGPNAARYNAGGEVNHYGKCINCNWGGATRLRSQFNHADYMAAMQAYNLAGHLQCPGGNTISGHAYPANN